MSKTYKRWKITEGTNNHHCINVSSGGKTVEENIIELNVRTHRAIHEVFGNDLPHEALKHLINTICKPFKDNLKQELLDVLNRRKGKEYKENTYYGNRVKHGPTKGTL